MENSKFTIISIVCFIVSFLDIKLENGFCASNHFEQIISASYFFMELEKEKQCGPCLIFSKDNPRR